MQLRYQTLLNARKNWALNSTQKRLVSKKVVTMTITENVIKSIFLPSFYVKNWICHNGKNLYG